MLRALLVAHLIVGTLTAPRPCPCSTPPAGTTTSVPAQAAGLRACGCCGGNLRPTDSTPRATGQPRPERPSDPCQCGVAVAAVLRPMFRSQFPGGPCDLGILGFVGPVFGFLPLPSASAGGAAHANPGSPFVTTDDLLHVFHNLRC